MFYCAYVRDRTWKLIVSLPKMIELKHIKIYKIELEIH
jgi:hypothetical protein